MAKVLIGNIKGPKGDTGSQGAQGDQGPQGTPGSIWYTGTGITGTAVEGTIFPGSGVTSANVDDQYLNTSTGNTYRCTVAGDANTAKWVYTGCIKGPQPELEDSLTSASTTKALTANGGKKLKSMIDDIEKYPLLVYPDATDKSYNATIVIENVDTTITVTNTNGDTGTYSYTKTGDTDTKSLAITIGTSIGFAANGQYVKSIESSAAGIVSCTLLDTNSSTIYSDTYKAWEHIMDNEANIVHATDITETYSGTTVTYKTGAISKLINAVRNTLYPVTHAKAVWFNKQANKTVYDELTTISENLTDISGMLNTFKVVASGYSGRELVNFLASYPEHSMFLLFAKRHADTTHGCCYLITKYESDSTPYTYPISNNGFELITNNSGTLWLVYGSTSDANRYSYDFSMIQIR